MFKDLLKEKGLTGYELSHKSNVPMSTIYRWQEKDNDFKRVEVYSLYCVAKALNMTIEDFLKTIKVI